MRVNNELIIEPARSWQRVQELKHWFDEDFERLQRENHQRFLEGLMQYERQEFLRVHPYQRHPGRVDQANGFYSRSLGTSLGLIMDLKVPRTRSGCFQTRVLGRYVRRQGRVDQTLRDVFLAGVSTRQTGRALAGLLDEAVSASTVSSVSKLLDENVRQWHQRPLTETYRYLILDGVSVRIRLAGKVRRMVALCVYGIDGMGGRQLISFLLVNTESQESWRSLLEDLWRRGLHGKRLELITTDGNPGLVAALEQIWPRVAHQRCWVHKLRNVENKLKASQRLCLEEAKLIYQAPHLQEALNRFRRWKNRWEFEAPKAVGCVEQDLESLLAFYRCPKDDWKRIRSTNIIERLFVEVRRRIRTMCSFTTRDSCERILYSVFYRMNHHWSKHPLKTFTQYN